MTSDEIRDMWLNFFKEKGHYIEPSASLIPQNDPTLLWINAGVAALKKYFDGREQPPHRRITNAQKAIRTNDIENVGHTSRHHTFFEMLGNFSIGDYFRNEVIVWASELLTSEKYFGFPKEKLYITYHPSDLDTKNLWIKCGFDESHLIPLSSNFWEVGQGPCGPDTEIYFDRGEKYDKDKVGIDLLKNDLDNDRYIEIWNIVFSQFNAEPGKERKDYKELPQKNIDTGAGLERFACVIQGVDTNFETDLFMPYINFLKEHSDVPYEGKNKYSYQVIADHIRSITFALSDGANFSNEGRGYVLRRLCRRMTRQAQILHIDSSLLVELIDKVVDNMKHFYPYLVEKKDRVKKMVDSEIKKFMTVLNDGSKRIEAQLKNCQNGTMDGHIAFMLSDTYGIPLDLTIEIASAHNVKVDEESYNQLLKEQKEKARKARGERNSFLSQSKDLLEFTEPSEFIYDEINDLKSKVIGLFIDGKRVKELTEEGDVVFNKTTFYAESGGQVSDIGTIKNNDCEADVVSVNKANHKQFMHHVNIAYGSIKEGDEFILRPDYVRRNLIKKNHSAAHLLQKTLQELLSRDIHQEGSFVSESEMRFDFNYDEKITDDKLAEIEKRMNELILNNLNCKTTIMDKSEALKTGAMALFNEKYDDKVRVVSFDDYSKEFCGGTHVNSSIDIMQFVIESCTSIAAGIKRIVAYTGVKAYEYMKKQEDSLDDMAKLLQVKSRKEIRAKLESLKKNIDELKINEKALEDKMASLYVENLRSEKKVVSNIATYSKKFDGLTHDQLLQMIKSLVKEEKTAVFIASSGKSKAEFVVGLSSDLTKEYRAGNIVKSLANLLNGSGGGREDIAFGGTQSLANFDISKKAFEEMFK